MTLPSWKLSFFLAKRYIARGSKWQTALVVFVMMLTFLNVVFVTGILVGLPEGSVQAYRNQYAGDILISRLPDKTEIERSVFVRSVIESLPEIEGYSARYSIGGEVEANIGRTVNTPDLLPDIINVPIVGIDPVRESLLTSIDELMLEGEFLDGGDDDKIVIGAQLIDRYLPGDFGIDTLEGVQIGDKVRVRIDSFERDYELKGILKSKAGPVDTRVYMLDTELRKIAGRTDFNVDEIAIKLVPGADITATKEAIIVAGVGEFAQVRTVREAIGTFLDDIQSTFETLGAVIGGIGLAVASITIFIVIFISAITRRKYIGILKAIGVTGITIEFSYLMLSFFYSIFGIFFGLLVLYGILEPYFAQNPIDFPFSDGILAVSAEGTAVRAVVVIIATLIAGYVPAKLIVRKKALDAILGR